MKNNVTEISTKYTLSIALGRELDEKEISMVETNPEIWQQAASIIRQGMNKKRTEFILRLLDESIPERMPEDFHQFMTKTVSDLVDLQVEICVAAIQSDSWEELFDKIGFRKEDEREIYKKGLKKELRRACKRLDILREPENPKYQ